MTRDFFHYFIFFITKSSFPISCMTEMPRNYWLARLRSILFMHAELQMMITIFLFYLYIYLFCQFEIKIMLNYLILWTDAE